MATSAGCNSRQEDIGALAALWRPVVTGRASQQVVGLVTELGVQEPARRNRRLGNRGQWPVSFDHDVAKFTALVE